MRYADEEKEEMICKKCKEPLKMVGDYLPTLEMYINYWECPKCDKIKESKKKTMGKKKDDSQR
jgi:RNase P subunit RPR2